MAQRGKPVTSTRRLLERVRVGDDLKLADHDPGETFGWTKETAKVDLDAERDRLAELQKMLFAEASRSVLVVLQAMDAGGKDGVLREVLTGLNPAGVRVSAFGVPSAEELGHDFLWRIHRHTPARGQIGVFNRSHYEDVLVVRVKQLVPPSVWRKRYAHIRRFERLLVDEGTHLVKICLHVSKEEQGRRLQARLDTPEKRWKFRLGDLDDRKLWDEFTAAYEDTIRETSTEWAPWHVVPSDHNWVRNLAVAEILVDAFERLDPQFPPADPQLDGVEVV